MDAARLDIAGATSSTLDLAHRRQRRPRRPDPRPRHRQRRLRGQRSGDRRPGDRRQQPAASSAPISRIAATPSATPSNLDADATDADGDALTYSATGLPAGASIAPGHRRHQRHADGAGRAAQRHDHRQRRHRHGDRHVHLDGHAAANTAPVVDSRPSRRRRPRPTRLLTATVTSHDAEATRSRRATSGRATAPTSPARPARRSTSRPRATATAAT